MSSEDLLAIKDLQVAYATLPVVWDVSLSVKKGEIVVLLGPNGHGKSTILKAVSGLVRPRSGVIFFEGKDITRVPAHTRVNMGVVQVPEGGRLFAQMSVLENLMLGGYTKDAWKKRNESLEKVYKIFPVLKERQNQPAHTLSGGERRMVAIGRGLMADSKLLMVDEPSLGLAPTLTTEVYRKMREINQLGVTLLLVEQNVKHVRGICSRAYLIENGRVFCEGLVDGVIEKGREVFLGK